LIKWFKILPSHLIKLPYFTQSSAVLVNKTILTDGRKGPDFTPFKAEVSELIKEIEVTKPTPVFKHANNLTRVISVEELKAMGIILPIWHMLIFL
jgi:hypothetical protein